MGGYLIMACDIMHLSFGSSGRDVDIVEPVLSYLEIKYRLNIVRGCVRDFVYMLEKYQPKALICGIKGSDYNVKIVKYAKELGIKIIAYEGEGDYLESKVEEFYWGWNKQHEILADLEMIWSQRIFSYIEKNIGDGRHPNIKVPGAAGFDRYKFMNFMAREAFLRKYSREKYKRVIGIASWWGFTPEWIKLIPKDAKIHEESKTIINKILKQIIESNLNILFILKVHPSVRDIYSVEFGGLENYSNTVIIYNEENIADIINVSDLWIGYESTTFMEAWLLGKTTFYINPKGGDFDRSIMFTGNPIAKSATEVQCYINEFYENGSIKDFEALKEKRSKIYTDIIGNDDGLNHVRAGEYVIELLQNIDEYPAKRCIGRTYFKEKIKNILYKICPNINGLKEDIFRFHSSFDTNFSMNEREQMHIRYKEALTEFYKKRGMIE